jgi:hypothetical protein
VRSDPTKANYPASDPAVVTQFLAKNIISRIGKLQADLKTCIDAMEEKDCSSERMYKFEGTCGNLPLDYYLVALVNKLSMLLEYEI